MLKIHLDEQVDHAVAQALALRLRGIDVTTTTDAGLVAATDEEQMAYATAQGRVLFTMDSDFLRVHDVSGSHRGIAYCPPGIRTISQIVGMLELMVNVMEVEEMRNHIEYL